MKKAPPIEQLSMQDWQKLQQELLSLRTEVSQLRAENKDLENSLLTAIEHGDLIEEELLDVNKSLKNEIIERKMAQATLQSILEIVYRDKSDLEIMLATATEHGDTIEYEQYNRAVETMRQSEEQFRTIAESTSMAMLVSRLADGIITYANTSAGTMLQRDVSSLLGTSVHELYYYETEWQDLHTCFDNNQKIRDYEIQLRQANSQPLWVLASLHLLWLNGEQVLLSTFYDITLLKNTEIALRQSESKLREQTNLLEQRVEERTFDLKKAKESAEAASRSKAAFLANMSHELRTPLNAILGFAQLMLYDQELNAQHQADLQTICNSGNHLLTMINDILEMSKLDAGSVLIREKECHLQEIIDTVKEILTLKAIEKQLEFDIRMDAGLPKMIYADEGKLRQILINLIGNAIKFTNSGYVYVRIFADNNAGDEQINSHTDKISGNTEQLISLCVEVEDSGVGIAETEIHTLFQPFVQTDSGRRSQEGTGLGLSISYNYVQLMGGNMSVTSELGVGSTFRFEIPIRSLDRFSDTSIKQSPRIINIHSNASYRILIAEDVRFNRQLLSRILKPFNLEIREVSNGEDAIATWRTWQPHLIWMDIRMPQLDGYEATAAIRASESQQNIPESERVKIIALTASLVNFKENNPQISGFDALIIKPFTEEQIFSKMAELLNLEYTYG
ncbi:MAG: ATP-binding protein [Pseudanabaenaceae cyanobacterium bins.39]|nr:ATP-binding protein [Pseudanabaenaceae cyanobacterium bins.39]